MKLHEIMSKGLILFSWLSAMLSAYLFLVKCNAICVSI